MKIKDGLKVVAGFWAVIVILFFIVYLEMFLAGAFPVLFIITVIFWISCFIFLFAAGDDDSGYGR